MNLQNKTFKTLLVFLIIFAAIFNFACPKIPFGNKAKLKDLWGQTFSIKNKGLTPKGANLWQAEGTTVTAEEITAVDEGLTRLFEKCKCAISEFDGKPYSKAVTHAEYIVAVLKSTDVDSNGDPAIRVPPAQYKGTIYDKGGYILIAGQVLAMGVPYGNVMALPDHQTNVKRFRDIVEYEGEHIVTGYNDTKLYYANETHGQGKGHPFIPDCPNARPKGEGGDFGGGGAGGRYAVGTYDTPQGKSLIFLTK